MIMIFSQIDICRDTVHFIENQLRNCLSLFWPIQQIKHLTNQCSSSYFGESYIKSELSWAHWFATLPTSLTVDILISCLATGMLLYQWKERLVMHTSCRCKSVGQLPGWGVRADEDPSWIKTLSLLNFCGMEWVCRRYALFYPYITQT